MHLVQNPLQSRRPGYREEAVDLEMGGQRYRAAKHVVTAPDSNGVEPVYISAANGFYEDPHIWRSRLPGDWRRLRKKPGNN